MYQHVMRDEWIYSLDNPHGMYVTADKRHRMLLRAHVILNDLTIMMCSAADQKMTVEPAAHCGKGRF